VDENGVWLYHENVTPTENGYWVEAKDLRVGDVFLGVDGKLSTLTNAVRIEQSGGVNVFNFSVEGNHNYFVLTKEYEYGQSCVLVHNAWYRRMKQNSDGTPILGDGMDKLGVRPKDIPVDHNGFVHPNTGGVSTSPNPNFLPTMKGKNMHDFKLDELPEGTKYRPDPQRPNEHGFIEPVAPMKIEVFKSIISGSQGGWH
jgi:Protein of unknown function (DUF1557).